MKKCLHELVGSLCLLESARWTYIPADGLAGPEDGAFQPGSAFLSWAPGMEFALYSWLLSWEYTSPVCGTPLRISMDKPYSLWSICGKELWAKTLPPPVSSIVM